MVIAKSSKIESPVIFGHVVHIAVETIELFSSSNQSQYKILLNLFYIIIVLNKYLTDELYFDAN